MNQIKINFKDYFSTPGMKRESVKKVTKRMEPIPEIVLDTNDTPLF
jgi:hypothetical protein